MAGDKIKSFIESELCCAKNFSDLQIPFGAVVTDMSSGEAVFFENGNLLDAVRTSISFPGVFKPVTINNRWFVDGGVVDPVPVDLAQKMGADFIVAVNLEARDGSYLHVEQGSKSLYNNIYSTMRIMQKKLATYSCLGADIVLSPEIGHYNWTKFTEAKKIITAGEDIARKHIAQIIKLLNT